MKESYTNPLCPYCSEEYFPTLEQVARAIKETLTLTCSKCNKTFDAEAEIEEVIWTNWTIEEQNDTDIEDEDEEETDK
jgi:uncharacterized protein YbaR (Trm112 family)